MRNRARFFTLTLVLSTMILSCGGDDTSGSQATLTLNLLPSAVEGLMRSTLPTHTQAFTPAVAQTTNTSLTSLQYFVQEIQLCQDMEITGTGYSNASGCITLYQTADSDSLSTDFYGTYTITDALTDTSEDHFIDFLSTEGQTKLASTPVTLTSSMIGEYHYGKIDYMRPIRIQAEFKDASGDTLIYTKTPSASNILALADDNGMERESLLLDNTTTAPAELMTYMLNNGGKWFPFLEPFEITQDDLDNEENITVDFVFNPDSFATASQMATCEEDTSGNSAAYDSTNCVSFDLPYAQLAPVPRRSNETTMKEVYLVEYISSGAQKSQLRVEVYYNSGDADKSVQGVDLAIIMDASATEAAGNIVQAYRVTEDGNTLTFYGYNENSGDIDAITLTGLERETDGTLSFNCNFVGGPCELDDGSSLTRSYTYEGAGSLN